MMHMLFKMSRDIYNINYFNIFCTSTSLVLSGDSTVSPHSHVFASIALCKTVISSVESFMYVAGSPHSHPVSYMQSVTKDK